MKPMIVSYVALFIAIVLETIATSALQASQQFTKTTPTLIMAVSYLIAFYCLSLALKTLPVGIAYAIWSGLGIVLISIIGLVLFKQQLDLPALLGIALIIMGVIVIQVFSKSISH